MCGRALFIVYIATFILTWPAHFAVRGTPKTRKEQCKELGYEVACTYKEKPNPCYVLSCGHRENINCSHRHYIRRPIILRNGVPDYTECGESKICMRGKCIAAPSMPHYRNRVHHVPCMQRYVAKGEPVPTRREQCQLLGLDVACIDDVRVAPTSCINLKCGYKDSDAFYLYRPPSKLFYIVYPLTGTRCGSNGVCLNHKCTPLNEWLLSKPHPTYTGQENWDICRDVNN